MNEQAKELADALLRSMADEIGWNSGPDDATEEANATRACVAAAKGALAAAQIIYPDQPVLLPAAAFEGVQSVAPEGGEA